MVFAQTLRHCVVRVNTGSGVSTLRVGSPVVIGQNEWCRTEIAMDR
jgi:hypothetical protein